MSLWNKVLRTEQPYIAGHDFSSIFSLWAIDHYDAAGAQAALESHLTANNVIVGGVPVPYTLTPAEVAEAATLHQKYSDAPNNRKIEWILRLNVCALELPTGRLSLADANTILTL